MSNCVNGTDQTGESQWQPVCVGNCEDLSHQERDLGGGAEMPGLPSDLAAGAGSLSPGFVPVEWGPVSAARGPAGLTSHKCSHQPRRGGFGS